MKLIRNLPLFPLRGLLKWRDVIRVIDWVKTSGGITLAGSSSVETPTGLQIIPPATAAVVPPLTVSGLPGAAYVSPGIIFAGAQWKAPVIAGQHLFHRPVLTDLFPEVWLKVIIRAQIALATYTSSDWWKWEGVILPEDDENPPVTIFADDVADHPNEPGIIHEVDISGDRSAYVVSDAVCYVHLATWSEAEQAYTNIDGGRQRLFLSSTPVSIGGGDYEYEPRMQATG